MVQLSEQRADEARELESRDDEDDDALATAAIQSLAEQFSGLEAGLQSINESLSSGMSEFAELAERSVAATVEPPPAAVPTPVAAAPASVATTGDEDAEPGDPQKLTIINRVPKVLTGIVKEQFALMNAWLEPIHQATRGQRSDMRKLEKKIDACLKAYQSLIERIDRKRP
jgi:hypothetical protein